MLLVFPCLLGRKLQTGFEVNPPSVSRSWVLCSRHIPLPLPNPGRDPSLPRDFSRASFCPSREERNMEMARLRQLLLRAEGG